jgi:hypothetical protein
MNTINTLVAPNEWCNAQGRWSGTEGRQHERYIAMIPVGRYNEMDGQDWSHAAPAPAPTTDWQRVVADAIERGLVRRTFRQPIGAATRKANQPKVTKGVAQLRAKFPWLWS